MTPPETPTSEGEDGTEKPPNLEPPKHLIEQEMDGDEISVERCDNEIEGTPDDTEGRASQDARATEGGESGDESEKEEQSTAKDETSETPAENQDGDAVSGSQEEEARKTEGEADKTAEEPLEMRDEEKQAMHDAVLEGDIDLLDDLLDEPASDINMVWFSENLLMTAIRAGHSDMCFFLLDNGVDCNFTALRLDIQKGEDVPEDAASPTPPQDGDTDKLKPGWYTTNCRQMAYEAGLEGVVELIDDMNGERWPFMKPLEREIRLKKPLEEKLRERAELEAERAAEDGETKTEDEEKRETGEKEKGGESGQEESKDGPDNEATVDNKQPGILKDAEDASSGYGSLSTPRSVTKEVTFCLPDPEERHLRRSPEEAPHHKPTKAYIYRKRFNERLVSSFRTSLDIDEMQLLTHRTSPKPMRPHHCYSNSNDATNGRAACTRVLSPWSDDDPGVLQHLKKRAKSADVIISGAKNQKPTLSRSSTLLSFVPQGNALPKLTSSRRSDSSLYEYKPRSMSLLAPAFRQKTYQSSTRWSKPCWQDPHVHRETHSRQEIRVRNRESPPLVKHNVRICQQGWALAAAGADDKFSEAKKFPARRYFGAKRSSPAGIVKTITRNGNGKLPLIV